MCTSLSRLCNSTCFILHFKMICYSAVVQNRSIYPDTSVLVRARGTLNLIYMNLTSKFVNYIKNPYRTKISSGLQTDLGVRASIRIAS